MLSVLAQGTLTAEPVKRTSSKGSTFATANVRATGEDGAPTWISAIAFDQVAVEALLALKAGDAVALAGEAAVWHWESANGEHRVGLRVTVRRVLSVHDARRERKAAAGRDRQEADR